MITIVLLLSHLLCLWKSISILNRFCVIWSVGPFLGPILPMKKNDFFLGRGPAQCLLVMERRCLSKPVINPTGPTPLIYKYFFLRNKHTYRGVRNEF